MHLRVASLTVVARATSSLRCCFGLANPESRIASWQPAARTSLGIYTQGTWIVSVMRAIDGRRVQPCIRGYSVNQIPALTRTNSLIESIY